MLLSSGTAHIPKLSMCIEGLCSCRILQKAWTCEMTMMWKLRMLLHKQSCSAKIRGQPLTMELPNCLLR